MRRDQLEHAIRTACQIIGTRDVIVVGSQSILGTFREDQLPTAATMSAEIDILPIASDNDETARLADLIEGVAGELSPFEELHGFSIDGVDLQTSALPAGWRDRLVKVQNANTAAPGGEPQYTGWCLDKEDLCVASSAPSGKGPELRRSPRPVGARRPRDHTHPAGHRRRALLRSSRAGWFLATVTADRQLIFASLAKRASGPSPKHLGVADGHGRASLDPSALTDTSLHQTPQFQRIPAFPTKHLTGR
jgi:hypothetical protein